MGAGAKPPGSTCVIMVSWHLLGSPGMGWMILAPAIDRNAHTRTECNAENGKCKWTRLEKLSYVPTIDYVRAAAAVYSMYSPSTMEPRQYASCFGTAG